MANARTHARAHARTQEGTATPSPTQAASSSAFADAPPGCVARPGVVGLGFVCFHDYTPNVVACYEQGDAVDVLYMGVWHPGRIRAVRRQGTNGSRTVYTVAYDECDSLSKVGADALRHKESCALSNNNVGAGGGKPKRASKRTRTEEDGGDTGHHGDTESLLAKVQGLYDKSVRDEALHNAKVYEYENTFGKYIDFCEGCHYEAAIDKNDGIVTADAPPNFFAFTHTGGFEAYREAVQTYISNLKTDRESVEQALSELNQEFKIVERENIDNCW